MWRRLRRIALPSVIIALVASVVFAGVSFGVWQHYRQSANTELASLLGTIQQQYPELDSAKLIRALTLSDDATSVVGAEILHTYGYTEDDFDLPSSKIYGATLLIIGFAAIACVALAFTGYFYYHDQRYRRQIRGLVGYVQKLNDRIYDLKIETNTEDELSLLSNELYKITVTLKEAAEYDRRTRHQLETALADISHQLKTPLTSLQIALDNLSADPDMPLEVRQDFLRSSSRQVVAMASLITTLLNLAKFDNGTIRMQRHVMPIGDILTRVYENLEVLADLEDINIEIQGDLAAQVKLDPRWQAEALSNIVKNCIEHSPARSTITINVEDSVLYTRVTIRDHGAGISPQDLHHIFERFYKAEGASAASVGIGLSFAQSVIKADHGQILAKSTLGKGTTFIVTYFH